MISRTWQETLTDLKCDISRYANPQTADSLLTTAFKSLYSHPAFAGVIYYRVGRYLWLNRHSRLTRVLFIIHRLFYPLIRSYSGLELAPRAQIESGLCVLHFGPTIIHPEVVAGHNLTLLPGVTIGATRTGIPRLGDDIAVGVGASVIGGIVVGNHVHIGAGAVVTHDLPDSCVAVGVPAQARPLN